MAQLSAAPTFDDVLRDIRGPEHWVDLMRVCNVRCVFCYMSEWMDGTMPKEPEIDAALAAGRSAGKTRVNFSGGEPTLHPKFAEICGKARAAGYEKIRVTTNGRGLRTRGLLDAAVSAGLDTVTLSVHGHTAELHEEQTKVKGSYADCLAALRHTLDDGRAFLEVDVVLSRVNFRDAAAMRRHFLGLGAHRVVFRQMQPHGDGWVNRDELFLMREGRAIPVWEWTERSEDPELAAASREALFHQMRCMVGAILHPANTAMFEGLLERGDRPYCWGERCSSCMLEEFCAGASRLQATGALEARPEAPCAAGPAAAAPTRGRGLQAYAEWFFTHRFRVKSKDCPSCSKDAACAGQSAERTLDAGFPAPPSTWIVP